jgi:arsenate reductase (thioredoxin)
MKTILFVCIHNAGRSQIAAAYFNDLADPARARATSAGTKPAERVHPEVVQVMRQVGVDLTDAKPQALTDENTRAANVLVAMGCGEECPVVPGVRREDWELGDPKGLPLDQVRKIRDEVRARVERLVTDLGVARAATAG